MKSVILTERTLFAGEEAYREKGSALKLTNKLADDLIKNGVAMEISGNVEEPSAAKQESPEQGGTAVAASGAADKKDGKMVDGPDDEQADDSQKRPGRSSL